MGAEVAREGREGRVERGVSKVMLEVRSRVKIRMKRMRKWLLIFTLPYCRFARICWQTCQGGAGGEGKGEGEGEEKEG